MSVDAYMALERYGRLLMRKQSCEPAAAVFRAAAAMAMSMGKGAAAMRLEAAAEEAEGVEEDEAVTL